MNSEQGLLPVQREAELGKLFAVRLMFISVPACPAEQLTPVYHGWVEVAIARYVIAVCQVLGINLYLGHGT